MQSVKMAFLGSYSIIVSSLVLIGTPLVLGLRVRSNLGPPISDNNILSPFRSVSGAKPKALTLNQIVESIVFFGESSYMVTNMISYSLVNFVDRMGSDTSAVRKEIEARFSRTLSQGAKTVGIVEKSLDDGSIDQEILALFVNIIYAMEKFDANAINLLETNQKALENVEASLGRQETKLSRMLRELRSDIQQYEKVSSSDRTTEVQRIARAVSITGEILRDTGVISERTYTKQARIAFYQKELLEFEEIFEDLIGFLQVVTSALSDN